ncbi:hypothetical protein AAFF_G00028230 [Aldrovandia affinis]|uniref:Uncharacterized protein n=1 Tax=Aldrovandia affinis TaxID=143900 RepID=A0AAD7S4F7_9TELE|nr:hypothetical protein AAFF_G00028230 [Aldrovandia affinis]
MFPYVSPRLLLSPLQFATLTEKGRATTPLPLQVLISAAAVRAPPDPQPHPRHLTPVWRPRQRAVENAVDTLAS